ncbi:MAG: hypothetical protein AABX96_04975 [Nanoarchaeota archaeon]
MPTEEQFVGIGNQQIIYGKKQLLYCEMEILTSLQKYDRYKKYRKEEFSIKNLLKKVIFEMRKEMDIIIQYLPQIKVSPNNAESIKILPEKKDSLEEEIQNIRRKIAILSAS